jgi:hypothetical protein
MDVSYKVQVTIKNATGVQTSAAVATALKSTLLGLTGFTAGSVICDVKVESSNSAMDITTRKGVATKHKAT